jgi:NAD(P)-dependent dehydrogenase (short-subunit alcohol dehydrogenase family)
MQRILVTGAGRGIGLELVRQFLARGDRVIATARKPGAASELNKLAFAHPGRLSVLPLDVARPASIDELAREVPLVAESIDVLVNNAGVLPAGERFGALEARHLEEAFRVNAMGPVLLTQALAPLFTRSGDAKVMNVSSVLGSIAERDAFYTPSYSISKAALNMGTRLLAHALADQGVTVFAIHPGWVRTDMGGPKAEVDVADSARGLIAVLDRVGPDDAGRFLTFEGAELPW